MLRRPEPWFGGLMRDFCDNLCMTVDLLGAEKSTGALAFSNAGTTWRQHGVLTPMLLIAMAGQSF